MSQSESTDERPRVVIVGGGFGGLTAARALSHAPLQITLIDRNNHHTFQPLLYQVATAGLSPAEIAAPIRSVLHSSANTEVLLAEALGVDAARQVVQTEEQEIPYDYLILATGARHSYFGHPEWEEYAPGLKDLTDATSIRRKILLAFEAAEQESDAAERQAHLTFALVGAGPTGVEMAGAIAELARYSLASDFRHIDPAQARVLLLEAGPKILASFPDTLSDRAQQALEKLGVEVRTGAKVEGIDAEGVLANGEPIPARTVLWTAGVMASPAGQWIGAETDRAGRILVEPDLSVKGQPNIFVIGDTMALQQDGKPLPGVAPVAMQQGRYVAKRLMDRVAGKTSPPFHYTDKGNLATVGRAFAILDAFGLRLSGFVAWAMWLTIHIFYLIGFRNRLLVMIQWAWAYITYQRGARLIIGAKQETEKQSSAANANLVKSSIHGTTELSPLNSPSGASLRTAGMQPSTLQDAPPASERTVQSMTEKETARTP